MPPHNHANNGDSPALEAAGDANRLLIKIVLFNLILYVIIFQLHLAGILGDSLFPSFVLFLSFAISIGNLLIIGLGQKIDLSKIDNKFIKQFGVTPIMIIVAVLASIFASFTPLANLIVPASMTFMLAKVGITCNATDKNFPPANDLLAFIYSQDDKYIKKIDDFLIGQSDNYVDKMKIFVRTYIMREQAAVPGIIIVKKDSSDEIYKLIKDFADTKQIGSGGLSGELSNKDKWTAYRVKVNAPSENTYIPVPTIYEQHHTTRLFLILSAPPSDVPDPAVASLNAAMPATSNAGAPTITQKKLSPQQKSLSSLIKVEIAPHTPHGPSGNTDMDVELFYNNEVPNNDKPKVCWSSTGV